MTRHALATIALALSLPAMLPAYEAPKVQDKNLEGVWHVTSVIDNGDEVQQYPDDPFSITIRGDSYKVEKLGVVWTGDSYKVETVGVVMEATIKVDASKTPKILDSTAETAPEMGHLSLGIYEANGDELRLCFAEVGKNRPTGFSAKAGSGWTLVVLKRVRK